MTTAENSDSVVSMLRRWCSTIEGYWLKVPRLLRFILVVSLTIGLIGAGAYIYAKHSAEADTGTLFSQISATKPQLDQQGHPLPPAETPFLATALRSAIAHDRWVIVGSFLVLITCAVVFAALMSFSKPGKKLSRYILAAVLVATAAHLFENTLISWGLNQPRTGLLGTFWIESPAAMNVVTWAALVVAVAAIPAAFFSVMRVILSYLRVRRYRQRDDDGRNWWDAALWSRAPDPVEANTDTEVAWRQAYYVPDAAERIPKQSDGALRPTALCLSGGGIRSACVSMGAMQMFAGPQGDDGETYPPVLDGFDWVISVSGGGFSAGARLLGVQCEATNGQPGGAIAPLCERFGPGSVEFDFLRRQSSYLAGSPLALLRALAEVLKNLLASLLIVSLSAIILGWLLGMLVARLPLAAVVTLKQAVPLPQQELPHHPVAALAAIAIPVVAAVICVALGLLCEWLSTSPRSAKWQARFAEAAGGAVFLALLVFALTIAGPGLMWLCLQRPDKGPAGAIGGIAAVVFLQYGATLSMMSKKDSFLNPSRWLKFVPSGVVRPAVVLLTLGVLLIGWLLALGIVAGQVFNAETGKPRLAALALISDRMSGWLGLIALLALLLSFFDVTSLSLHPFYRQRLASTFAVRRVCKEGVEKAVKYEPHEATWLDKYGKTQAGGPKFVFAAAAAISDGDIRPPPGLNAVSFVMTADYVGGPALGWLKTPELCRAAPPRIERDLTVEAAVAVSGAAFASAMGRQNKGIQTLLALSGARLGTWLPNPRFARMARCKAAELSFPKALPSVRGAGYFYRELFGINKSDARLVQVTDGGHYENLGLVEALRRRCRLIYCIDGGGDAGPLLYGLADAIRLARFELGVEITLENDGPFGVENVAPGSGDQFGNGHGFHSLNARITKGAVVRGEIKYPRAAGLGDEARSGWLIVAKAVLWRDLPDWVLTYAAEKGGAEFPHDNTSDQWFTEGQFAAYTELGRRVAVQAMRVQVPRPKSPMEAATNGEGHADSPTTAPGTAKTAGSAQARVSPSPPATPAPPIL
jgi:hypothetical protein